MLYLETPVNTGFSLASKIHENSDALTAKQNVAALRSFFNKFPSLKKRDFYITGESYAGRYIPQLSVEILNSKDISGILTFKGVAIGNGFFDEENEHINYYGYTHGIVDSPDDGNERKKTWNVLSEYNISKYNILQDEPNDGSISYIFWAKMRRLSGEDDNNDKDLKNVKFLVSDPDIFLQNWLNRDDVQRAAHVQLPVGKKWEKCYLYDYKYGKGSMESEVKQMVNSGIKVNR